MVGKRPSRKLTNVDFCCCRWFLRTVVGEYFVDLAHSVVHGMLRSNRLPSIFVKFSNPTKFEVPASVWLKNGYVPDRRMWIICYCGSVLRKTAGENVVGLARPDVHSMLQPNRFPSNFVNFSNPAKFEVPDSVWSKNGYVPDGQMLIICYCG